MPNKLTDQGREKVRKQLLRKALKLESYWKKEVPVYTGQYKNSIEAKIIDDTTARVGTNLEKAPVLEYGLGQGTFPDTSELKKWVDRKINPQDENLDQVTFLIGRKIKQEGVDENHALQRAIRKFKTTE